MQFFSAAGRPNVYEKTMATEGQYNEIFVQRNKFLHRSEISTSY